MTVRHFVSLLLLLCPVTSNAAWNYGGTTVATVLGAPYPYCGTASSDNFQGVIVPFFSDTFQGATVPFFHTQKASFTYIYAQRVDQSGNTQWGPNGVLASYGDTQQRPTAMSDGAGGAFIVWGDARAQHMSGSGQVLWPPTGINACSILWAAHDAIGIPDGAGGVIIAWTDNRVNSYPLGDVYAQRISAAGQVAWATNGVPISQTADAEAVGSILPDGAGGAFIAYHRQNDVYAQRISGDGTLQWSSNGVPISLADNDQDHPVIAFDGAGGIIAAWDDVRGNTYWDVYVQRINGAGVPQWTIDGINVMPGASGSGYATYPTIVSGAGGGAVVAWRWWNTGVNAQKVNASGQPQWPGIDGVVVSNQGYGLDLSLAPDASGGAFLAWTAYSTIFVQRIGAAGTPNWPMNGFHVSYNSLEDRYPSVVRSGDGAIVTWASKQNTGIQIRATRLLGTVTGIHDTPRPAALALGDFSPNPFSSSTHTEITLDRGANVRVEVFDVAGHRVRAIEMGHLPAGASPLMFDGLDENAHALPSGAYFYRVHAGAETVTKKMIIAR